MTNVISFPGVTTYDLNAADMLEAIAEDNPQNAFVICWPEDGSLPTYHSSTGDTPVVLYRLQEFIYQVYRGDFDD